MPYKDEGTITLKLLAQDLASGKVGTFVGHLDRLAQKGGLVGSIAQGVGQSLGQMLNPIGAVTSGVGMLTDYLGAAVTAAAEEEAGIKRLTTAISENDRAWDGNMGAVEDVIAARERLAFSDGEQRDSLAKLVAITKDVGRALELQRVAMDLARLRGMALGDAGELIGKVYGGNVGILARYGIQLRKGATATDALREVQRMSAGQAQAYADTTAGAMSSLQIALDDLQEDIGRELLPVMKDLATFARDDLVPAISDTIRMIKDLSSYSDELGTVLSVITGNVVNQNAAIEDWFASLDPWARTFHDLGAELGYSRVQVYRLAEQFRSEGRSIVDFGAYLGGLRGDVEGVGDAAGDAAGDIGALPSAMRAAARATVDWSAMTDGIVAEFETVTRKVRGKMRSFRRVAIADPLRSAKREARRRMAEVVWALKHPMSEAELEKEYRREIRKGTKAMNDALRTGNAAAYAKASKFVTDMKAKLAELEQVDISINLRMRQAQYHDLRNAAPGYWQSEHRAGGGPVMAGHPYVVGERRAEVFVPDRDGTILPSTRGLGATYVYAPTYSTASPAEAQRLMTAIGPEMERWMARRP